MKKGLFGSLFSKIAGNDKDDTQTVESVFNDYDEIVGRWNILVRYGKEKTPELSEKVFKELSERSDRCALILMDYNQKEQIKASENMSWLYDVDYEKLNCNSVCQIVTVGKRCYDYQIRCLMAGISETIIDCLGVVEAAKDAVRLADIDTVCFLVAPSVSVSMEALKEELKARMKKEEEI